MSYSERAAALLCFRSKAAEWHSDCNESINFVMTIELEREDIVSRNPGQSQPENGRTLPEFQTISFNLHEKTSIPICSNRNSWIGSWIHPTVSGWTTNPLAAWVNVVPLGADVIELLRGTLVFPFSPCGFKQPNVSHGISGKIYYIDLFESINQFI